VNLLRSPGTVGSLAVLLLAGCTVGPNYHRPSAATAPSWKENVVPPPNPPNGTWKEAEPSDAVLRGNWWDMYGDPELSSLEAKVSVSNQTLRAAMEQYLQATEQVRVARSEYYPTLAAGPSVSRTSNATNTPTSVPGVSKYQYSLRAELASDYFEMRGMDSQKQLLDNTVKSYEDYLKLTEIRYRGGVATEADVALAQTQLETTQAQDIDVGVARAQYEHAIATLIGVPASDFGLPPMPLGSDIPQIPVGVPSQLLERRPDIAASEREIDAANAQIGIAIAAYYPSIFLNGQGGFLSGTAGTWIQGPSAMWSLGASATELLFDAGRRHAFTQQARDAYEQQVANYRQTVLSAFEDVEDNLAALRILDQESVAQAQAVSSAENSLRINTSLYKEGATTYLTVLTAQTVLLSNQRTQEDVATRQFVASVQLIRALGGGWNTSQLPKL